MSRAGALRGYLVELIVIFVGVALAFAVENWREELGERAVEREYLHGFRQDFESDLVMLARERTIREAQLRDAKTALEFFDGRTLDTAEFFGAFYAFMPEQHTVPNRNTMDEVLNSGNLRLISSVELRAAILDLYAIYGRIARTEAHMARDFDEYLYDTTFTLIPLNIPGPWPDTPASRAAAQALLDEVAIANGVRLLIANLEYPGGLLDDFAAAEAQLVSLLQRLPPQ